MNNLQLRKIKSDAQICSAELAERRTQENRAHEAGMNGDTFPQDLAFRGRLAQAYWDGVETRKQHTKLNNTRMAE